MSRKATFDHNKAKAILKERDGTNISFEKTGKEFGMSTRQVSKLTQGSNGKLMCFLLDFCNKHKLTIQDIITIIDE